MRITTLVENDALDGQDGLIPEFGLSLFIDFGDHRILFDAGSTGAFAANATTLGVNLAEVDLAVLSHQHFDHGGGLERFLEINDRAPVYLRESAVANRFSEAPEIAKRSIGLDRELLERSSDRFTFIDGPREIAPDVFLLTDIGSGHRKPEGNKMLFVEKDGRLVPDTFDHELIMVIRDRGGLVVFTGCSHHGVLNMIDAAIDRFPGEPIEAIMGGFHLIGLPTGNTMSASRDEVEEMGHRILAHSPAKVFTGHCTGEKAFGVLEGVMGDTLEAFHTGTVIDL